MTLETLAAIYSLAVVIEMMGFLIRGVRRDG